MPFGVQYLFVDGDYFLTACSALITPVFQIEPDIDFREMRQDLDCQKAFYYGCVDDVRRPAEDQATYEVRVEAQEKRHERIQAAPGVHVRLGTLAGTKPKRLRQKEVDVQLAVDMLSHAFAKNMSSAILVTGDLDFRPVVRTLMQFGTYVRLCFMAESVARDLLWASDEGLEMTVERVYRWTTNEFRSQYPFPIVQAFAVPPDKVFAATQGVLNRRGQVGQSNLEAWFTESDRMYHIVVVSDGGRYLSYTHKDSNLVERFVGIKQGEIRWSD